MALSSEELRQRLWAYRKQNWKNVQTHEWQKKILEEQMAFDATPILEKIMVRFGLSAAELRYLDVGSGIGDYVLAAKKMGIESYGVEPDRIGIGSKETSLVIARDRAEGAHTFVSAVGEALPFSNAYFDLITMNQVLEHVQDLNAVLNEALRVLKPGGILLFNSPNYLSFYEPHYKVFWLPLFPRIPANIYLRLRGRDTQFLQGINYLTRAKLNRLLSRLPCRFEDEQLSYISGRMQDVRHVHNRVLRLGAITMKKLGLEQVAIWIYINLYIQGLSYVVVKDGGK